MARTTASIVTVDVLRETFIRRFASFVSQARSKARLDSLAATFADQDHINQYQAKLCASSVLPAKEVSRELAIDLEKTLRACFASVAHSASKVNQFVNSQLRLVLPELQV
jgi:hypothetical protein